MLLIAVSHGRVLNYYFTVSTVILQLLHYPRKTTQHIPEGTLVPLRGLSGQAVRQKQGKHTQTFTTYDH